jgi:hypothetical protein
LSYLERIQRTLPEEYFAVFPEKPDVEEWKPISGSSLVIELIKTDLGVAMIVTSYLRRYGPGTMLV